VGAVAISTRRINLRPMSWCTRWAVLTLCSVAGVSAAAPATEGLRASKREVKKEVVAVIEAQLTAFRKGDIARAYTYAASELKAQKPLPVFSAIAKQNYPEIWANTRAEFGIVRDDSRRATVTVQVYSKNDDAAYDFTLAREREGWRIYGVVRHAPPQTGKL
jgi:hypothetical protein